MTTYESRPNAIPWPPLIYILAIAIAVALGWFLPLPWIAAPLPSHFLPVSFAMTMRRPTLASVHFPSQVVL